MRREEVVGQISGIEGIGGRGELILSASLPRIARRGETVKALLSEYAITGDRDTLNTLLNMKGSEGLATLSVLPESSREEVFKALGFTGKELSTLQEITKLLGRPVDTNSPAAGLIQAFPPATEPELALEGTSTRPTSPASKPGHSPDIEELATLSATIELWEDEEAALEALSRLAPAMAEYGSPLPVDFWLRVLKKVERLEESSQYPLLYWLAAILYQQGAEEEGLELFERGFGFAEQDSELISQPDEPKSLERILVLRAQQGDREAIAQLFRIGRNRVLEYVRGEKPVFPPKGEEKERVEALLQQLNPRYRQAIELRLHHELPREECARKLGISSSTFDILLHRACRAFRILWERQEKKPDGSPDP